MYKVFSSPPLKGEATVATSKNAVLPQMAAALLTDETVFLRAAPALTDTEAMQALLMALGCSAEKRDGGMLLRAAEAAPFPIGDEATRKMRASILVMGPLLGRFGSCRLAMPGGCAIGARPIDLHLKGFAAMGARIDVEHGCVTASCERLNGASIVLDQPSVGATENLLCAAALARGCTRLENAAREPEVVDLCALLCKMGARIEGAGTDLVLVEGVDRLHGAEHTPIPDRIEAGTLLMMASYPGCDVLLRGADASQMHALLFKLREAGAEIHEYPGGLRIRGAALDPMDIRTLAYPGFPTDMQSLWMARMTTAHGVSVLYETLFENRFQAAEELCRMGAEIRTEGRMAVVNGVDRLKGARVLCPDLRSGAALLTAALYAEGSTEISHTSHIRRGYENILAKLRTLGARVEEDPLRD